MKVLELQSYLATSCDMCLAPNTYRLLKRIELRRLTYRKFSCLSLCYSVRLSCSQNEGKEKKKKNKITRKIFEIETFHCQCA